MDVKLLLPHMYYFWLVAKYKSLSKTAEELNVSTSAVSYQIKCLEEKLNMFLLKHESGQKPELTDLGNKVAIECQKVFSYMHGVMGNAITGKVVHNIRVSSPVSFGRYLIMPSLPYITNQLNNVELKLRLMEGMIDNPENEIDIIIQNTKPEENFDYEVFMRIKYVAIASTKYLSESSAIKTIKDIQYHRIISTDALADWGRIGELYPDLVLPPEEKITYFNNNISIVDGVRKGYGIALVPDYVENIINTEEEEIEIILSDYFSDENLDIMDTMYACYPKLSINISTIKDVVAKFKDYFRRVKNQRVA